MENLLLEIFDIATKDNPNPTGSKFAVLDDDASITINVTSEIFASGDVWTHSFSLKVLANAHIFGTAGDLHGSRLHEQVDKRRARLWVMGLPLYLGYLKLDDEAEVDADGYVDVTLESGQKTFENMIEGAKASQVPMLGDVQIGVALWRKRAVSGDLRMQAEPVLDGYAASVCSSAVSWSGTDHIHYQADGDTDAVQEYPRMVFPTGSFVNIATGAEEPVSCVNTDSPYTEDDDGTPTHPYCNVALCYQKYGYDKKDDKGNITPDYSSEPEAQRGYEYMPADRVNSAPNFYVLYWLRCLMKHLGIHIEENQMMDVEDLRRLFFVNTRCEYREPDARKSPRSSPGAPDARFRWYRFLSGKRLVAEQVMPDGGDRRPLVKVEDCGFTCTLRTVGEPLVPEGWYIPHIPEVKGVNVTVTAVDSWTADGKRMYEDANSYLHDAIATSDCFPDVDISEVISAIENGFGVRLLFSDSYQRVRVVLLRNVFLSQEVQDISCEIIGKDVKVENSTRGFRLTYGKGKEDTHFYYKGFADKLLHQKTLWPDTSDRHDYSHWSLDAKYGDVINKVTAFDKTCYVTPVNGNAYIIKVDKDAKRYEDLHPSLFEGAGFEDSEDGDCTGTDETVKEITMGFTPAIMNDLNMEEERRAQGDDGRRQRFALFVSEQMRPRRPDLDDGQDYNDPATAYYVDSVPEGIGGRENRKYLYGGNSPASGMKDGGVVKPGEFAITSDMYQAYPGMTATLKVLMAGRYGTEAEDKLVNVTWDVEFNADGHINEGYRLYLQDNFEPNDDGVSPVETHDWGLTLGIMRGSGSDAYVNYSADPDDGEGNDTWDVVAGSSVTSHPDTCDCYGNIWDYTVETGGRTVLAQHLREAGWHVDADDSQAIAYSYHYTLVTAEGNLDLLLTPITDMARHARSYTSDPVPAVLTQQELETYVQGLWDRHGWDFTAVDNGEYILSARRADGSLAYADGRFSLKLRAEKPNPYYDLTLPSVITTKEQAGRAMTALYRTASCDLLDRPSVSADNMRRGGWNIDGDYATLHGVRYAVSCADGTVHEILWTPIKPSGAVLTPEQLQRYVRGFGGLAESEIVSHDEEHLIVDIDTTEQRAEILHRLQAVYYARPGEVADGADIEPLRYLRITTPSLRGRGIRDQLYREYSAWIRNARIVKRSVRMGLAQLLSIDRTKRVRVGDITGFLRKMQYTVSKRDGMGTVTMEIMYI